MLLVSTLCPENHAQTCVYALCSNHYYVVKLLLDKGCDVNVRDNRGDTPLHVATTLGFSRLVALLLSQPNCQINPRVTLFKSIGHKCIASCHTLPLPRNLSVQKCIINFHYRMEGVTLHSIYHLKHSDQL